ncbi:MAG: response regulator [Caldilineae bacterium]|nr:MAG: response regulator [Caldilineae bacterium]
MEALITQIGIRYEQDVVYARRRAHLIAEQLGFGPQDRTRISTAVSEIARNAFVYAGGGKVQFYVVGDAPEQCLRMVVQDTGKGIANLDEIMSGDYRSRTGMGLGMIGSARLMDDFRVESEPGKGTKVVMEKRLPPTAEPVTMQSLNRLAEALMKAEPENPLEEVRLQNQELIQALQEVERQREELLQLNQELAEKNRSIMALYQEVEDKARELAEANKFKDSFISQVSHEFRTPLSVIVGLADLLLSGLEGELNEEQQTQVRYILQAANDLSNMVNDLLDLAKIKAGKTEVYAREFKVGELLGTLRGMMAPMVESDKVQLVFEEVGDLPPMYSDEGKISQILRNFLSNAIKFTEEGEIRTTARLTDDGRSVVFAVKDTGIGIAEEDLDRIFEEYEQVAGAQKTHKFKSTGLGLPISKKLAELLGGSVGVESELGKGSTFYAVIPIRYEPPREEEAAPVEVPVVSRTVKEEAPVAVPEPAAQEAVAIPEAETAPTAQPSEPKPELAPTAQPSGPEQPSAPEPPEHDPLRYPVVLIYDDPSTLKRYEEFLLGSKYEVVPCSALMLTPQDVARLEPLLVVVDVLLLGDDTTALISALKEHGATGDIPIVVASVASEEEKAHKLGVDEFVPKPVKRNWLWNLLAELEEQQPVEKILVVDDQALARYVLRALLADTRFQVVEAEDGETGLALAHEEHPAAVYLDLILPGISGMEVLERLKAAPETRDIPVVINTGKNLSPEEEAFLNQHAAAVVTKGASSPDEATEIIRQALRKAIAGGRSG